MYTKNVSFHSCQNFLQLSCNDKNKLLWMKFWNTFWPELQPFFAQTQPDQVYTAKHVLFSKKNSFSQPLKSSLENELQVSSPLWPYQSNGRASSIFWISSLSFLFYHRTKLHKFSWRNFIFLLSFKYNLTCTILHMQLIITMKELQVSFLDYFFQFFILPLHQAYISFYDVTSILS